MRRLHGTEQFRGLSSNLPVLIALIIVSGASNAMADNNANSQVIPVDAKHRGLSYAEWSARQWQWLFSLPVDEHPLFDNADCSSGQSGKVWFLGGTFAAVEVEPGVIIGEADRICTIPSSTSLFFPLIDVECSTIEGNGETEAELRDCANFFADFIVPSSVFLEIDGRSVTNVDSLRVESPLFLLGPLPENNILGDDGLAGAVGPAVSDGYWAMVKPLSVGVHTLRFGGLVDLTSIGGPIFIQDIAYVINVVPGGQYD